MHVDGIVYWTILNTNWRWTAYSAGRPLSTGLANIMYKAVSKMMGLMLWKRLSIVCLLLPLCKKEASYSLLHYFSLSQKLERLCELLLFLSLKHSSLVISVLCVWFNALLERSNLPCRVWLVCSGRELQDNKAAIGFLFPLSVPVVFFTLYYKSLKKLLSWMQWTLYGRYCYFPAAWKIGRGFDFGDRKTSEFVLCCELCQWLISFKIRRSTNIAWSYF